MKDPIFFVALLPPKEIQDEITAFKEFASEHFESSHALKSPPHVTLFPPFRWKAEEIQKVSEVLENFAKDQNSFYLQLNNFSSFSPRVIFVEVERKPELIQLQKDLEQQFLNRLNLKNTSPHSFSPHVTVAFKDLKRQYFLRAWAYFSQIRYERIFQVNALTLLKHNGEFWELHSEFKIK